MPKRILTDEQREQIAVLREKGWSLPRIAAKLGVTKSCVGWTCLLLGADTKQAQSYTPRTMVMQRGNHTLRRFTSEEDAVLLAMDAAGKSYSMMARKLGRRPNSIKGRLLTLARRERLQEQNNPKGVSRHE